jgi:hypothetical protein
LVVFSSDKVMFQVFTNFSYLSYGFMNTKGD